MGIYFSDEAQAADPALSTVTLTTDTGASVTFAPEEIPAFAYVYYN